MMEEKRQSYKEAMAEIEEIVAREQVLREEIDRIIAEIEE